jgi:ComF family protein
VQRHFLITQKKNQYAILLHNLKYKRQQNMGIFLGETFAAELLKSGFLDGIDAIVPVPLHNKRERNRGYNQSQIIAQGIANISKIEVLDSAVIRTVNTQTQTKKSKEERKQNVANIFEVANLDQLQGKHILILDDVITTGATCISCAETILEQGFVKEISIASIGIVR